MSSPVSISVHADVKRVTKALSAMAYKQVPYATALALTSLAKRVQDAEKANIKATFNNPKPFTVNSVGMQGARKSNLTATVFVRPIAASYLAPYAFGGVHKLNSSALLNPKDIRLDQYGNIPRSALRRLRARKDVFIGAVKTKAGSVNGVWQRLPAKRNQPGHLKLLIRFGDALPVTQHLDYRARASAIVGRFFNKDFGAALGRAIASAK